MKALIALGLILLLIHPAQANRGGGTFQTFKLADALNRFRAYVVCRKLTAEDFAPISDRLLPWKYRTFRIPGASGSSNSHFITTCSISNPAPGKLAQKIPYQPASY
jgi:hypothetical protein